MKSLSRLFRPALLLALATASLALGAPAKSTPSQQLFANLRKELQAATPTAPAVPNAPASAANGAFGNLLRYVDQAETFANQGRLVEAEQMLGQTRTMLPASNPGAAAALDQVIADLRARTAEVVAQQEAAYSALEKDFVAKFNSKAPAAAFDASLQQLAALAPTLSNNGNSSPIAQKLELLRNLIARWQDYLLQSAAGNNQQATQTLNDLVQQSTRLPIIPRSQLMAMASEASAKLNTGALTADARLEPLRRKLTGLIDSAKSAADFDALLAEIPRGNNGNYPSGQMEQLRRMIVRWQDYYSQLDAGNGQAAQNVLRELANDQNTELYYPRSKILARLNGQPLPPATPATPAPKPLENPDATDPLVTPEELTPATLDRLARQLAARRTMMPPGTEDLPQEVNRLRTIAQHVQIGNGQAALAMLNNPTTGLARWGGYTSALFKLQQLLLTQAFARLANIPPSLQPEDGEFLEAYIARLWQRALEKKDWALIYRILTTNSTVARPGFSTENPDLQAYRGFFAGLQQERAGLWAAAARSYFNALRVAGPNLPAEELGARLAELKRDHPEEYANAEKYPYGEGAAPMNPRSYITDPRGGVPMPQMVAPPVPLTPPVVPLVPAK